MTREVLLTIKGLQFSFEKEGVEEEAIETVMAAEYFNRNGSHYIVYEEPCEDSEEVTQTRIKYRDGYLEVTKKGFANVHMIFEEKKKNISGYSTPFGEILVGIEAKKVKFTEDASHIHVDAEYELEINYEYIADCRIVIEVQAKEKSTSEE